MLPADNHSHSEWSWDAIAGSMDGSCARAAELGLPAITFTEHVDLTRWVIAPERRALLKVHADLVGPDGRFDAPPLDLDGYLACVERCRARYPGLRILAGAEVESPHWHADRVQALLATGTFDRVIGGLHSVVADGGPWMFEELYQPYAPPGLDPAGVMRAYLTEALAMAGSTGPFEVLAHIDYPVRDWPAASGPFDPAVFEDEYRAVLRALAGSGRALEVNTRVPLSPEIVRWWHQEGGDAVSFGSDAHTPPAVADGFAEAAAMVRGCGFRPGREPHHLWRRA
jgi:histidinol-phosphatase (PHP family)